MPFSIPDYATVEAQALAFFRNRFPGKDTHLESFLGKTARALARLISQFHVSARSADNDAIPSNLTSTAGLDRAGFTYGLPTTVSGKYGRKGPTASSGGVFHATGSNGSTIPDATVLVAPDGVTLLKTSGAQTVSGGVADCTVIGVTLGTAGNLPVGTTLTFQSTPAGLNATGTLTTATGKATDSETNATFFARILNRLQNPPRGGTSSDFRTWAEEVSGVFRAYTYPLRGGMDTVHVVITAGGSGVSGRDPGAAVKEEVDDFIVGDIAEGVEGQKPTTVEGYSTIRPYFSASGLAIRLRMVPALSKYAFDWALGLTSLTVASYSVVLGVAGIITNEALPSALTDAIDAYKSGLAPAPRLQVMSSNAVFNPMVQISDYNAGTPSLTLLSLPPTGWVAPIATDHLYPGAAGVFPVASAILAYVDSLGPSRASGYADPNDFWEDTCAIARLIEVALDQTDTINGAKFFGNSLVNGVTVNGSATDVEATDDLNGVQILYAKSIAVTD